MRKLFLVFILLFPSLACSAVLYTDSWDYTYLKDYDDADTSGLYIHYYPDYCVNPNSDGCDDAHLDCRQDMGTVWAVGNIPDTDVCGAVDPCYPCRHSFNLGGTSDGFPVMDGSKSLRVYIDVDDDPVKSHDWRAEIVSNTGSSTSHAYTVGTTRWFGMAMYVPDLATTNFTYADSGIYQWHNNGYVPFFLKLHGGVHNSYVPEIVLKAIYTVGTGSDQYMICVSASGRCNSYDQFIIKNTGSNGSGSIDDLGDWVYLVWVYNQHPSSGGRYVLWYASQADIDGCGTTGITCYTKAYDGGTDFATGYSSGANWMKMGIDEPGSPGTTTDYFPLVRYFDNFSIASATGSGDTTDFAQVDPANYASSIPGANLL